MLCISAQSTSSKAIGWPPVVTGQTMASLHNGAVHFPAAIQHHSPEQETFKEIFECWLVEQKQHLQELVSAVNDLEQKSSLQDEEARNAEERCSRLIALVLNHYESYYESKSKWEEQNVLAMLTPSWRSTLEDAFLWIGGWRPTMAIHLLYSKAGLQFEAHYAEGLSGLTTTGDLGNLASGQVVKIDQLQREIIKEERRITEKMAKQQERVADKSTVELSHIVSDMIRSRVGSREGGGGLEEEKRVASNLESKEEGLKKVIRQADELRMRTLKSIIEMLSTKQAAYFLIAASELHLRVHEWGQKKDANDKHSEDQRK